MIYIKYIDKDDPTKWVIYAHKKGSTEETMLFDSDGYMQITADDGFYLKKSTLDLKRDKEYFKIKYLTEEEVDLLKLELL